MIPPEENKTKRSSPKKRASPLSLHKQLPNLFSCRHGIRHWYRITPSPHKYIIIAVVITISFTTSQYLLSSSGGSNGSSSGIPAINQPHRKIEEKTKPTLTELYDSIISPPQQTQEQQIQATNGSLTNLSPTEWINIQSLISKKSYKNKALLCWPTIPLSLKGSDSRAIDAVRFLTQAGYKVDLIYWRDYSTESRQEHDDTVDRELLAAAGVHRILGPYDQIKLSDSHTFVSDYAVMFYWLWTDFEFLDAVIDFVDFVGRQNGRTKFVAAVDDAGVSSRLLMGACHNSSRSTEDVENFVLGLRPKGLLGVEEGGSSSDESGSVVMGEEEFDVWKLKYAKRLIQQEMYLYMNSDLLVGINSYTTEFLKKMVPGVPTRQLSYVSPAQPNYNYLSSSKNTFSQRSGYVFFGYNNFANNIGMDWFQREVLPHINTDHLLHIAGTVYIPKICDCSSQKSACTSLHPNVVCHGAMTDDELEHLIKSVKLAINPVLEPSGVATKTCRAMAFGTPVVVSNQDGTFDKNRLSNGAKRCIKGPDDTICFKTEINTLLSDEEAWNQASNAAPAFIAEKFGAGQYMRDWVQIIETLITQEYNILVHGNALENGESMASQNWHIANMLSKVEGFTVKVMGDNLEPQITGVELVKPPPDVFQVGYHHPLNAFKEYHARTLNFRGYANNPLPNNPFTTGYQANVIIRQNWPPLLETPHPSFCGPRCRVASILPWEFGFLPQSWMKRIKDNSDFLWAPTSYNKRIFENSGLESDRSQVMTAGIDCDLLESHKKQSNVSEEEPKSDKPVTFVFTGGFIPRKGIDILFQEWQTLFCQPTWSSQSNHNVKLIVQTSYELGYTSTQISQFENIIQSCNNNIEWKRNTWMERQEHLDMIMGADVYVAPFRSEGFGLPNVEAMILGLNVITSVGGTAADDYMVSSGEDAKKLYPVQAVEQQCHMDPCNAPNKELCVFTPCKNGKCSCETLVDTPSWFEVNRTDLRVQILNVYQDVKANREKRSSKELISDGSRSTTTTGATKFCWSELGNTYKNGVFSVMEEQMKREYPPVEPVTKIWRFLVILSVSVAIGLLVGLAFYLWRIWKLGGFRRGGDRKKKLQICDRAIVHANSGEFLIVRGDKDN